jgi:hypothetical protein
MSSQREPIRPLNPYLLEFTASEDERLLAAPVHQSANQLQPVRESPGRPYARSIRTYSAVQKRSGHRDQ